MAQNGAAHDGQVRVGAHKVVGELLDEIQELAEGGAVDLHGHVRSVEDDAVLVVVDIGAVLEEPVLAVNGDGDDAVVLPGGVVHTARVALVLPAELALGIAALGRRLGGGDGPGVLLRFGEVDSDIQVAVGRGSHPLHVLCDAVAENVIGVLAELIVPVCGGLRGFLIPGPERPDDLGGPGRQAAHQLGVKEVPAGGVILDTAVLHSPVQKVFQNLFQGAVLRSVRLFPVVQLQSLQQAVGGPGAVTVLVPFTPAGRRPRGGSSPHGSFPGPKRPRSFP